MTSLAEECWRLSKDCGQWAVESRDGAARLAFRQMATAWARLAFDEEFTSPAGLEKWATATNPPAEDARNLLDDGKLIDSTWSRLAFKEELTSPAAEAHTEKNATSPPAMPPPTVNENGAIARNPAAEDTRNYEHSRPSTDKTPDFSWTHIRLSLRSPMSFPKR